MGRFRGLRYRLIVLAVIAFFPAFVITLAALAQQREVVHESVREETRLLARIASRGPEQLLDGSRQFLLTLSESPAVKEGNGAACSLALADVLRRSSKYLNLGLADLSGSVVCSAVRPSESVTVSDRGWFQRLLVSPDFAVGEYQIGRIVAVPTLVLGYPVFDDRGQPQGAVFAALDLGALNELTSDPSLPEGAVLTIFDREGTIVARYPSPDGWIGRTAFDSDLLRAVRSRAEGTTEVAGVDGVLRMYGFRGLSGAGKGSLYLTLGLRTEVEGQRSERIFMSSLIFLGLAAVGAIVMTWVLGNALILRRVNRLAQAARHLTGGDLSQRSGVSGGDEIGEMGLAFDGMAERLQSMIAAEQEAKNSLERQVSSLVGERTRQLELLREVSELLQSCQTLEEAFDVVGQLAGRCFPGASGAVCIIRESRDGVEVKVTWDNPHMQRGAVFVPEECWALRRGRIHQVDPSAISVQCAHLEGDEPVAYFCLPLSAYGEALGMLHISSGLLTSDEVPDDWLSLRRTLAEELADPLSLALANLKLRETLRQQSIRDPLTGLFNRRYMEETLHRELRRAARTQQSLAVLMLDIDHFKQFNDSFGHDAGDELLRHLGGVLQRGTRSADIACRYGGEEFTVILPGATREQARQRAEVLRGATKAMDVSYLGQHLGAVTISIGLAAFSDDGETVEGLLREADQALYRAKSSGRDRVETAREVSPRVEDEALDDATPPVPIRSTGA